MHKGVTETQTFLESFLGRDLPSAVDVMVCPPFTSLPVASMLTSGSRVMVGAQNVHWQSAGAFTGEIAPVMLAELGVGWAIVGHSERRTIFGESDSTVLRRAGAAQEAGLRVIYCIGETLEERDEDQTYSVLDRQTAELGALDPHSLVVAYEPVWAIGTGRNATPEQAQEAHHYLRTHLEGTFGADAARGLRILYGGSLKPENAHELLSQPDVDGGLIGGASLDADSFSAIIHAAAECAAGELD
jgi:triosephosphate isomerase